MFNKLKFYYFFWRFNDGKFISKSQREMFKLCEKGRRLTELEFRGKDSEITLFLVSYAAWKSSQKYKVTLITRSEGKRAYFSNQYNYSPQGSASCFICTNISEMKDAAKFDFDYVLVGDKLSLECEESLFRKTKKAFIKIFSR
jgi:hypothetical protein